MRADADAAPSWRAAEAAFAVLLLLASTLGPVYRVNLELGGRAVDYAEDPRVVAFFALIYVVAGLLGIRAREETNPVPVVLSVVLASMLMASSLWSVDRRLSATQSVLAALTLAAPWFLARRFRAPEVVAMAWAATFTGILASGCALVLDDPLARDLRGDWAGIYFNRNSLGMVAGVCIVLGSVCALGAHRDLHVRLRGPLRVAAGVSVPVAGLLLWGSGSRTSLGAVAAAMALWGCAALAGRLGPRDAVRAIWAVLALGGIAVALLLRFGAGLVGSNATLQGRTTVWSYLLDRVAERPFTGHGWLATFSTVEFWRFQRENLNYPVQVAHNSLLEVAVGAGVPAAVVLVVVCAMGLQVGVAEAARSPAQAGALVVAVYFLGVGVAETVVGANHLLWILFLAVCAYRWRPKREPRPT